MEIDFTDQIKKLRARKECGCNDNCSCEGNCGGNCDCQESQANEKAGYPPNCNEGYKEKDGKCIIIEGYRDKKTMAEKHYPGENVKRRKDGVPAKKKKKRATKKGEHRDKSGKLVKNGKAAYYKELYKKVKGL